MKSKWYRSKATRYPHKIQIQLGTSLVKDPPVMFVNLSNDSFDADDAGEITFTSGRASPVSCLLYHLFLWSAVNHLLLNQHVPAMCLLSVTHTTRVAPFSSPLALVYQFQLLSLLSPASSPKSLLVFHHQSTTNESCILLKLAL